MDPPDRLNLLGIVMPGAGLLPAGKPVFTGAITAPPKGHTAKYGDGANLTGGVEGQLGP